MQSAIPKAATLFIALLLCPIVNCEARADDSIEHAGNALQYVLPWMAGGLVLLHKDGKGLLQFGESAAVTYGVTYGLKYAVNERRPNGDRYSFPSGHSSFAFCTAEFMRKRYGWEYGVPAYALASFVAYSRVEARKHYAQDVVAGAAIGIISSHIFTRPYRGWHLQAQSDGRYYSISLARSW